MPSPTSQEELVDRLREPLMAALAQVDNTSNSLAWIANEALDAFRDAIGPDLIERLTSAPAGEDAEITALGILREIVRANREAPDFGMCDARDNDGEWYQSADLAAWLDQALTLLAAAPSTPTATGNGWPADAEFRDGDQVTTPRAPFWQGRVCGWYINSEGRLGFNVEATAIPLAIHNYPQTGLRMAEAPTGDQP